MKKDTVNREISQQLNSQLKELNDLKLNETHGTITIWNTIREILTRVTKHNLGTKVAKSKKE